MVWRAYICEHAGDRSRPVDMKGVVLSTPEEARDWLLPSPIRPKYVRTHPELEGQKIELVEEDH